MNRSELLRNLARVTISCRPTRTAPLADSVAEYLAAGLRAAKRRS